MHRGGRYIGFDVFETEDCLAWLDVLQRRFGSASVFLISHRITTLSKADQILVLDHGRIAEMGTHEQLKTGGGIYQKICEIQSASAEEVGA